MTIDGHNVILVRGAFECDMTDMICYQGMPAKERTKVCASMYFKRQSSPISYETI